MKKKYIIPKTNIIRLNLNGNVMDGIDIGNIQEGGLDGASGQAAKGYTPSRDYSTNDHNDTGSSYKYNVWEE